MPNKEFIVDIDINIENLLGKVGIEEVPNGLSEDLLDFWEDNWSCEACYGKLSMSYVANCINIPRKGEWLSSYPNFENLVEQFFNENESILSKYIGLAKMDLPVLFTYSRLIEEIYYIPVHLYVTEEDLDYYIPHVKCRFDWQIEKDKEG